MNVGRQVLSANVFVQRAIEFLPPVVTFFEKKSSSIATSSG